MRVSRLRQIFAIFMLILVGAPNSGCLTLATPQLLDPTPLAAQRSRAQQFDPFPENEPGPAIEGARPREFAKSIAEPRRARLLPWWLRPPR